MSHKIETRTSFVCLLIFLALAYNGHAQVIRSDSPWIQRDKLVHFSYCAGFTPAIIQIMEVKNVRHAELKGAAILFGIGVIKEFTIDKTPRYQDITVNLAGCLTGIALNRLLMKIGKMSAKTKNSVSQRITGRIILTNSPPSPLFAKRGVDASR